MSDWRLMGSFGRGGPGKVQTDEPPHPEEHSGSALILTLPTACGGADPSEEAANCAELSDEALELVQGILQSVEKVPFEEFVAGGGLDSLHDGHTGKLGTARRARVPP